MASRSDIRAGRAFVELYVRDKLSRGLRGAGNSLKSFGRGLMSVGKTMSLIRTAAVLPLAAALKIFSDFDDQMREVAAVSGATGAGFQKLTETAKELGRTTSFTASQVAALMAELGRAGFSADQIDRMTGAVLNLAAATKTDATQASGIMAATIRQFGLAGEDAGRVSDALTIAANKSFNTVEQLGEALSYAGPVAADFNMSLEETLAVLGALGNVGIQGSNAGTAVRRLLTLSGAEAAKMEKIFGVQFADAAGNARPLVDVLGEVNEATKNLGSADRAKKFNEAFGLLGITGASAISKSTDGVKELFEAIKSGEGTAERTAEAMNAGLGGSFRKLLSAAEGVALAIGEALTGSVQDFMDRVTELLGKVTEWINQNKDLVLGFGLAIVKLGTLGGIVMAAGAAFIALGATLGAAAGLISGVATAISAVGAVAAFVVTPVGALVAILSVGLVAAIAAVIYQSKGFRDAFINGFSGLVDTARQTFGGIVDAIALGDLEAAWDIALQGMYVAWLEVLHTMLVAYGEFAMSVGQLLMNAVKLGLDPSKAAAAALTGGMMALKTGKSIADLPAELLGSMAGFAAELPEKLALEQGELFNKRFDLLQRREQAANDPRNAPVRAPGGFLEDVEQGSIGDAIQEAVDRAAGAARGGDGEADFDAMRRNRNAPVKAIETDEERRERIAREKIARIEEERKQRAVDAAMGLPVESSTAGGPRGSFSAAGALAMFGGSDSPAKTLREILMENREHRKATKFMVTVLEGMKRNMMLEFN